MSDALADVLSSVRMEGSIFSRAALTAPWGVESGRSDAGMFHAVVAGHAWARLADGGDPVELRRGDVVLMPFGDNHLMTDAPGRPTRPIGTLSTVDARGMGHLVVEGGGPATSLICGTITFDRAGAHPVFSTMPRLIHIRDEEMRMTAVVERLVELIADEIDHAVPGAETVVARLTDVLLVYVLRSYIRGLGPGEGGWLAALNEPGIRDALGLIHRHPRRRWTADELAARCGMSRSAFYARFRTTVGETPGAYATRWRVQLAMRLLRDEGRSVAATARAVGYTTEAAFSNAFLRVTGLRPGAYRRAA